MIDKPNEANPDYPLTAADLEDLPFGEWVLETGVSVKEAKFVKEWMHSLNYAEAFRATGDGTGDDDADLASGQRMIRRGRVSRLMTRSAADRGITTLWMIDRLAGIVNTNLSDLYDWSAPNHARLKSPQEMTPEQRASIKSYEHDPETGAEKITMHPKLDALAQIARVTGMNRDRAEITGKNGEQIKVLISKEDAQVL